jgi:hypothetical protein
MRWSVNNKNTYIAWSIVFAASLGAVAVFHYFPVSIVGELAGVPAIVALFAALFQLSRDRIAFDRSVQLEEAKNRFTVGAMSHMANVAFDKHVLFSEAYTAAAYRAMDTLFRRGPHQDVLRDVLTLAEIRTTWTVWLTPVMTTELGKFETALRKIGANALVMETLRDVDSPNEETRIRAVKEAHQTFAEVVGFDTWEGKPLTKEYTVEAVVEKLRKVLKITELTELRTDLIERSSETLK